MGAATGCELHPSGQWEEAEGSRHGPDQSLHPDVTQEDAEPVSPSSLLTEMLRNSPSSKQGNPVDSPSRDDSEYGNMDQFVEPLWKGVSSAVNERTSLLPKGHEQKLRHLSKSGAQDLESQRTSLGSGWFGARHMSLRPNKAHLDLVRSIISPKRWNIRRRDIIRPVTYVPAVILGLLLNILDALSYGQLHRVPRWPVRANTNGRNDSFPSRTANL